MNRIVATFGAAELGGESGRSRATSIFRENDASFQHGHLCLRQSQYGLHIWELHLVKALQLHYLMPNK